MAECAFRQELPKQGISLQKEHVTCGEHTHGGGQYCIVHDPDPQKDAKVFRQALADRLQNPEKAPQKIPREAQKKPCVWRAPFFPRVLFFRAIWKATSICAERCFWDMRISVKRPLAVTQISVTRPLPVPHLSLARRLAVTQISVTRPLAVTQISVDASIGDYAFFSGASIGGDADFRDAFFGSVFEFAPSRAAGCGAGSCPPLAPGNCASVPAIRGLTV